MRRVLGAGVTLLIGLAIIVAVAIGFHEQKYHAVVGPEKAKPTGTFETVNGKNLPVYTLSLTSFPDSSGMTKDASGNLVPIHKGGNPGWPAFGPSNDFEIPAGVLVKVNWHQYDSGEPLNNNWFASPKGIVGPMLIDGKPQATIDPEFVGHTFTVRGAPGTDPNFFLNVASPANIADEPTNDDPMASSPKEPGGQLVQFSFISPKKGIYAWNCEFPCGASIANFGAVMGAYGYMSGYIHVV